MSNPFKTMKKIKTAFKTVQTEFVMIEDSVRKIKSVMQELLTDDKEIKNHEN